MGQQSVDGTFQVVDFVFAGFAPSKFPFPLFQGDEKYIALVSGLNISMDGNFLALEALSDFLTGRLNSSKVYSSHL